MRGGVDPKSSPRFGFTLAEVLITLGIIGVVAAMTIPNLISTHEKKTTVTKLQKSISVLNQAYRMSFEEFGDPDDILTLGAEKYFKQYWAPYMKVSVYCKTHKTCGYDTPTPFKFVDGTQIATVFVTDSTRVSFLTPDGYMYMILVASGTQVKTGVWVDINGSKKPNIVGKDVFLLVRAGEKGVLPYGHQKDLNTLKQQCVRSNGYYCAELIKRAGWQIDKSYPWK